MGKSLGEMVDDHPRKLSFFGQQGAGVAPGKRLLRRGNRGK